MPRKAAEVLFTPRGRDTNPTSAGPGRGGTALKLALEALSWNKDVCFCSQNGFRLAAVNTDPLQSPSPKQRRAGGRRGPGGHSTGGVTCSALDHGSMPGWQDCTSRPTPHLPCDAGPWHYLPSPSGVPQEMQFLILTKGDSLAPNC